VVTVAIYGAVTVQEYGSLHLWNRFSRNTINRDGSRRMGKTKPTTAPQKWAEWLMLSLLRLPI
jgi:hypothetical protein